MVNKRQGAVVRATPTNSLATGDEIIYVNGYISDKPDIVAKKPAETGDAGANTGISGYNAVRTISA